MSLAALGRDHHDWHIFRILDPGELFDEFQSIHDRHVDVAQNQVDDTFLQNAQRLGPVSSLEYIGKVDAGLAQRALYYLSHDRRVVDDERTDGHIVCDRSPPGSNAFSLRRFLYRQAYSGL